ncbi:MAG: tyrosine--tRNA ligase, partial [Propionivibrio sp.]|nr:tyrosine--tRNA ligase [Candidatus Propionivibrio dominans]
DELMWRYYDLLSFRASEEVAGFKREVASGRNPRDVKVLLAQEIVARFHGAAASVDALSDFEARFRQGAIPDDIPEVVLDSVNGELSVAQVLKQSGLTSSTSEALRMIGQGGVKVDGAKIDNKNLAFPARNDFVLQVGKRKFARVKIR